MAAAMGRVDGNARALSRLYQGIVNVGYGGGRFRIWVGAIGGGTGHVLPLNQRFLHVTAVLPKIPHSNCCKRVPNRPLRGRGGRFGTILQLLECEIFGRTALGHPSRQQV